MKTDAERQLQARLGPALDGLLPRPAPLAAIVRDGRRVRARKWISRATGLAAAAAAVTAATLTLPSFFAGPAPAPPLTTHYHVTANVPGPHSPTGLIANGQVNGVPWSVRASFTRLGYFFTGVDTYASPGSDILPSRDAQGDPVDDFLQEYGAGRAIQVDAVRADVTLVKVSLTNGQVLSLRPVAAIGPANASLVAFATPDYRDVLAIEAFNKNGEIGYTVPWTGHTWFTIGRWLQPGQPALPQPQTAVIGSGTAFGHSWRELLSVGPWGWCSQGDVDGSGGGEGCSAALPALRRGQYYQAEGFAESVLGKSGVILSAEVADSVATIELTTRSGQHTWIRPHRVGGRSFISFATAIDSQAAQNVIRWAAYDGHHHLLGSGPIQ